MKFINYLTAIGGVEVYPLISLLIFALFFAGIAYWALKVSKQRIEEISQIPFNQDNSSQPS